MRVIGICGTNGSGKGILCDFLVKYANCKHVSARDLIIEKAKQNGVEVVTRPQMREFMEKYNREGHSLLDDFLIDCKDEEEIIAFESIRRVSEIKRFRNSGINFLLVSVDADPKIRFERAILRGSNTDHVTFEEFLIQEQNESNAIEENQMNILKCIELADVKLTNDGNMNKFQDEIKEKLLVKDFFKLIEKYDTITQ